MTLTFASPSLSCDGIAQVKVPKKRALLITAGDVPNCPPLVQAKGDTWALKELLMDTFHYDDIVIMMKDEEIDKSLWPRRNNICVQLKRLVRESSPGDHLFVYFSGHGIQLECPHRTETDGYDECILDCNGERITDNVLCKYLVQDLNKECRLFALLDTCHSRTMLDLAHYKCNEPHAKSSTSSKSRRSRKGSAHLPEILTNRTSYHSPTSRGRSTIPKSHVIPWDPCGTSFPIGPDAKRFRSPESIHPPEPIASITKCDGQCVLPTPNVRETLAHIVSLSACRDNEEAHDDEETNESLTKFFIAYMRNKPNATLRQLLDHLRMKVNQMIQRKRNVNTSDSFVPRRLNTFGEEQTADNEDSPQSCVVPQIPGYSSHFKLDLDEPVGL